MLSGTGHVDALVITHMHDALAREVGGQDVEEAAVAFLASALAGQIDLAPSVVAVAAQQVFQHGAWQVHVARDDDGLARIAHSGKHPAHGRAGRAQQLLELHFTLLDVFAEAQAGVESRVNVVKSDFTRTRPREGRLAATPLKFHTHLVKVEKAHLLPKHAEKVVRAVDFAHKQGVKDVEGHDIVGKQTCDEPVFAWALGCVAQPIIQSVCLNVGTGIRAAGRHGHTLKVLPTARHRLQAARIGPSFLQMALYPSRIRVPQPQEDVLGSLVAKKAAADARRVQVRPREACKPGFHLATHYRDAIPLRVSIRVFLRVSFAHHTRRRT